MWCTYESHLCDVRDHVGVAAVERDRLLVLGHVAALLLGAQLQGAPLGRERLRGGRSQRGRSMWWGDGGVSYSGAATR